MTQQTPEGQSLTQALAARDDADTTTQDVNGQPLDARDESAPDHVREDFTTPQDRPEPSGQLDPSDTSEAEQGELVEDDGPEQVPGQANDFKGTDVPEVGDESEQDREARLNGIPRDDDDTVELKGAAGELVDKWDTSNLDERNVLMARLRRSLGRD